jgi:aspartyl aminopeptidase
VSSSTSPLNAARDLLAFLEASPTPFHCVAECRRRLTAAGFREMDERDPWSVGPGDRGFTVRGDASIVVWRRGTKAPEASGFRVVGAHTDSPNLRLKPRMTRPSNGHLLLDVEIYGGVLLATWADRDLSLAGRVYVDGPQGPESRLVRFDRPLCRIPNVAIHLNRGVNDEGLVLDKHKHLAPVLGLWSGEGDPETAVRALVAEAIGVAPDRILGHDLCLYDVQPPSLSGLDDAFVHAARLDNQAMCHAGLTALLSLGETPEVTSVVALFDHEECGSASSRGAEGPFLADVLERLAGEGRDASARAMRRSFCLSADMAHALHPNFGDKHDGRHQPVLNGGPVVKTNVNMRYATDAETSALFRRLCRRHDVPVQEFVSRADLACGTTIGPITATRLGIPTLDVGNPMLSMHSIREMCGSRDQAMMTKAMGAFLAGE